MGSSQLTTSFIFCTVHLQRINNYVFVCSKMLVLLQSGKLNIAKLINLGI